MRPNLHSRNLLLLILADVLMFFATTGESSSRQAFAEFPPLSWSDSSYQTYQGVFIAFDALSLMFGVPIMMRVMHISETGVLVAGSLSRLLSSVLEALSFTSIVFIVAGAAGAFKYAGLIMFRTMASTHVEEHEQDRLFAFVSIAETAGNLLATIVYSAMLTASASMSWKGSIFVLSSVVALYPLAVSLLMHLKREQVA